MLLTLFCKPAGVRCFVALFLRKTGNQIRQDRLNFDKPLIALQSFNFSNSKSELKTVKMRLHGFVYLDEFICTFLENKRASTPWYEMMTKSCSEEPKRSHQLMILLIIVFLFWSKFELIYSVLCMSEVWENQRKGRRFRIFLYNLTCSVLSI